MATVENRPAHHANDTKSAFQNPWPSAIAPSWADLASMSFPFSWYPKLQHSHRPIQVVEPDWGLSKLKSPTSSQSKDYIVGTWLGHAGVLAEFKSLSPASSDNSTYILFDPIFSERAGPTTRTGPSRIKKNPCNIEDLPGCDAVCISHNHYDHLDWPTVEQIKEKFPAAKWFVPLGNKSWLLETGIKAENVEEMDWWDSWEGLKAFDSEKKCSSFLRVSCVPAQHNSGRWGYDQGSTLWSGWVIERFVGDGQNDTRRGSVYHAGDTGYRRSSKAKDICPAFKEIGEKFRGFDLSFIPIWRGGSLGFISYIGLRLHHHEIPSQNHCSPADAVQIHKDVRSRNTIAIHFGTFAGSELESDEALKEFYEALEKEEVHELNSEIFDEKGRAGAIDIGESAPIEIN